MNKNFRKIVGVETSTIEFVKTFKENKFFGLKSQHKDQEIVFIAELSAR